MTRPELTPTQRRLIGVVVTGAVLIAAIGFVGSYAAVRELAEEKGFGTFAVVFPIGIDAGIGVLLALDLLLTWVRIPFPLLRHTAWVLTAGTIAFNAAAAWPDPVGVGMHAVIPVLFVVVVEAARHAVGRIADITADRHMEGVRLTRWLLSPVPTFRLWRRMKLWEIRSYDDVIQLEQDRLVYRARLQMKYGRNWRRKAPIEAMMPLRLTKYGRALTPITIAPERTPITSGPSLADHAAQAIAVVAEHEHQPAEQIANTPNTTPTEPNAVREQIANSAVNSPNTDRAQPVIADLVREQIALTTTNADAVKGVLAIIPDANKASVAAAVRRARKANNDMKGGYA